MIHFLWLASAFTYKYWLVVGPPLWKIFVSFFPLSNWVPITAMKKACLACFHHKHIYTSELLFFSMSSTSHSRTDTPWFAEGFIVTYSLLKVFPKLTLRSNGLRHLRPFEKTTHNNAIAQLLECFHIHQLNWTVNSFKPPNQEINPNTWLSWKIKFELISNNRFGA